MLGLNMTADLNALQRKIQMDADFILGALLRKSVI